LFQGKSPVTWTTEVHKINAQEYQLVFTATIEDGWNIYSQYLKSDDGPVKTSFTYSSKDGYALLGKNEESA
jgi:thiol:disulfide interchange protein DsbD